MNDYNTFTLVYNGMRLHQHFLDLSSFIIDEAVLILVSTLFNICAFLINASNCQEAYLKLSAINTTIESRCRSENTKGPFSAYTYSSDGLQVEDSDSSRVISDVKPSPVKSAYGRGGGRGAGISGGRGGKGG